MVEAVETMDGWYSLHDFRTVDWNSWKLVSEEERQEAIASLQQMITQWEEVELAKNGSHALYNIVGQKADLMFMFLRPTTNELAAIENELNKSKMGEFLIPAHSYFSVVELSKYRPYKEEHPELIPEVAERLKPILPKWEHVCFYPMDRRRHGEENWYTLEKDVRGKLLYEHSMTGRKYAGKVSQIITGSIGLDDWEWGVTLFAHDPLQFKKIVYEMRFDEVSSKYGEFGEFFVGNHLANKDIVPFFEI
ncbi:MULTISPECIES: hydrogen peroxide-dependent heme synthase [Virgibacillus]|nr:MULTISPECIES: hydrogen peroxide-dependent heme synthase [Virgibacillus]MBS7430309.1 heme-dependent peroxidase [Virgibacillus sp. 19R1-5]MBU8567421.1 heme-dependent peroxidase [Virgibacillus pantothenticus]MBU8599002.1 heme-dependent peroxidase [Virgibacillus pantothenticus]MBU8633732.1 heme-dependent peroxidase [Virgibacillus pantothenticus]MBU8641250.1 heme-dependent peroxidase [Virgibacillus pantothenticus]